MESTTADTTIFTAKRTTTLLASLVVALACGTNYVRNFTSHVRDPHPNRLTTLKFIPRFIPVCSITPQWRRDERRGVTRFVQHMARNSGVVCSCHLRNRTWSVSVEIVRMYPLSNHLVDSSKPSAVGVYASGPLIGKLIDLTGPRPSLALAFVLLLSGYLGIKAVYDAPEGNTGHAGERTLFALILFQLLSGIGSDAGFTVALNAVVRSFPDKIVSSNPGFRSSSTLTMHPLGHS